MYMSYGKGLLGHLKSLLGYGRKAYWNDCCSNYQDAILLFLLHQLVHCSILVEICTFSIMWIASYQLRRCRWYSFWRCTHFGGSGSYQRLNLKALKIRSCWIFILTERHMVQSLENVVSHHFAPRLYSAHGICKLVVSMEMVISHTYFVLLSPALNN